MLQYKYYYKVVANKRHMAMFVVKSFVIKIIGQDSGSINCELYMGEGGGRVIKVNVVQQIYAAQYIPQHISNVFLCS